MKYSAILGLLASACAAPAPPQGAPAPRPPAEVQPPQPPSAQAAEKICEARVPCEALCKSAASRTACHLSTLYSAAGDKATLAFFLGRACELGDANDCVMAAVMASPGGGAGRSHEREQFFYERGCDAGSPEACIKAGDLLTHPTFSPADPEGERAEALYLKAGDRNLASDVVRKRVGDLCHAQPAKNPESCYEALRDFRALTDIGTPKATDADLRIYTELVREACLNGSFEDCGKFPELPEPEPPPCIPLSLTDDRCYDFSVDGGIP